MGLLQDNPRLLLPGANCVLWTPGACIVERKSRTSVAGRPGAPPDDATREDLVRNHSHRLRGEGETFSSVVIGNYAVWPVTGPPEQKPRPSTSVDPISAPYIGPNEVRLRSFAASSGQPSRLKMKRWACPAEAQSAKAGGAAGHRTRVRSAYLRAFIAIVRLPGRVRI